MLHIVMIVSFMSLALTGMTLKFSYTGWAAILSRLLGGFETAGYIHRAAAMVMVGDLRHPPLDLLPPQAERSTAPGGRCSSAPTRCCPRDRTSGTSSAP